MALNRTYLNTINWRSIVGIIAIFCVVLSSCAVKASIKSHLGVHTTAQKTSLSKQGNTFVASGVNCCFDTEVRALNLQQVDVKFGGFSVALLTCLAFSFFAFGFLTKQKRHSLYYGGQITGNLPIFLQYRKLII